MKQLKIPCQYAGAQAVIIRVFNDDTARVKVGPKLLRVSTDELTLNGKVVTELIDSVTKEEPRPEEGMVMYHDFYGDVLVTGETSDTMGRKVLYIEPFKV